MTMAEMTNADFFQREFGIYATELWAMTEQQFLVWLNAPFDKERTKGMQSVQITGWWDTRSEVYYTCSNCGRRSWHATNYCPHCGADMRGDSDGRSD